eukprot:CAMPEP_0175079292 /NCGR_PEP_ID=MMETSP0052_2-20121109/24734_1 /TAXON_ID=51329 ORGANISM="Polytomella parva, Strain SAG 63-3" /NCGR_SAMPLE_ID=MMETSP0052_2 /ASSEMBLY_ACC=CAM_ASM_000194 /LENGTH=1320 /DNA_ID=CAMNT_0016349591 /DNA_START=62 /DNA_END=4023 /DNA_ORIENTATION=+
MLTKFETKSNRVKGLSFHPKRPWILASLHSGVIQLWDYRMGTLIDRFDEHEGPVRGVHFHKSQPLFVSGGDDYKIKVWNYKLRRCLFTLLGHLDYIRTVQFHHESPWIVSASDDQTIRIWNWQSRACVSVLTGHNHYVMCALFHPKEDLVVSASLDQTVRVWDIGALKKKSVTPSSDESLRIPQLQLQMNADLFGGGDAIVKYVLESHDRGVNWAAFHPSLPLIVSGADDRQIKLWRYNESKAWEVDSLRGHANNVSCVMFHSRQDLIVSNSEDKSIRVWDMTKRLCVHTFRREHDRFWVLTAHPEVNLLAAGHDSGMIVFKLERERPAFACQGTQIFYVRDRYLRVLDTATQRDVALVPVRRGGLVGSNNGPKALSYNPAESCVLVSSDLEGGSFELYNVPKEPIRSDVPECKRGLGSCAVFIARNRFAALDRPTNTIHIRNLQNEITKKVPAPLPGTDAIFYAGTGMLLCRSEDKLVLFDVQQRSVTAEVSSPPVKYVVWNTDMSQVALLSKHAVVVAGKKLQDAATVHETMRVKSAVWDDTGVLVYSTLNHIKYCLPNGDSGVIRTLDAPLYLTKLNGTLLHALDREGKARQMQIDPSEYVFKLALFQRRFEVVVAMVKSGALKGAAIIGYLQQKGFPEVALHFVKDPRIRFQLAVQCGNIEVALQSAQELDERLTWERLGVEALRQGNHQVAEFSYQRVRAFDRLAFLYLASGNQEKLGKVARLAASRGDFNGRLQAAMYQGDILELICVLEETGQLPLAYVAAATHGLKTVASRLAAQIMASNGNATPTKLPAISAKAELLRVPEPLLHEDNWPLLTITKGFFEALASGGASGKAGGGVDGKVAGGVGGGSAAGKSGGSMSAAEAARQAAAALDVDEATLEGAGWGNEELDLDLGSAGGAKEKGEAGGATGGKGSGTKGAGGGGGGGAGKGSGEGEGEGDEEASEGWDMEDLDLPADLGSGGGGAGGHGGPFGGGSSGAAHGGEAPFSAPAPGVSAAQRWIDRRHVLAGELVAAGAFGAAMSLLKTQIGAIDFEPLKPIFLDLHAASFAVCPALHGVPSILTHLDQTHLRDASAQPPSAPSLIFSLTALEEMLRAAYRLVTEGKFSDALRMFTRILRTIPFTVVATAKEAADVRELVTICREYHTAIRCELRRKELKEGNEDVAKRGAELAAYFTHAKLQPAHTVLALRQAMNVFFKLRNFNLCAGFCRRLLELNAGPKIAEQARAVLTACERSPGDAVPLNYDPRNPFDLCPITFQPIYKGYKSAVDPYTKARFAPECEGQISPLGDFVRVGAEGTGLAVCAAAAAAAGTGGMH